MGDETQAGPEEQSPRDRSEGRLCHVTEYPFLEDCGKTKQSEWSSVTFWSWPCVPVEASRLLLICEENTDRFCSMGAFPLLARRNICCGCTRAVGIGANRTSTKIYEYAP